jgi:hypothetical protein
VHLFQGRRRRRPSSLRLGTHPNLLLGPAASAIRQTPGHARPATLVSKEPVSRVGHQPDRPSSFPSRRASFPPGPPHPGPTPWQSPCRPGLVPSDGGVWWYRSTTSICLVTVRMKCRSDAFWSPAPRARIGPQSRHIDTQETGPWITRTEVAFSTLAVARETLATSISGLTQYEGTATPNIHA